jgi:hypothetical protein
MTGKSRDRKTVGLGAEVGESREVDPLERKARIDEDGAFAGPELVACEDDHLTVRNVGLDGPKQRSSSRGFPISMHREAKAIRNSGCSSIR